MSASEAEKEIYELRDLSTTELEALLRESPPGDEFTGALLDEYARRTETNVPEIDSLRNKCKEALLLETPKARNIPKGKLWRVALIAAAAAIFLIGAAYAAVVLEWLPTWDDDWFSFTKSAQPEPLDASLFSECTSLEETLAALGALENMIPRYVPEGYEPAEFDLYVAPNGMSVSCVEYYSNGENDIGYI